MQWEIALPGNRRRNVDVRRLFGAQTIAQRVEDLPLGEASGPCCVVGSQVLCTSFERTDLELPYQRVPHTIQPSERPRIPISATMAAATRVRDDDEPRSEERR